MNKEARMSSSNAVGEGHKDVGSFVWTIIAWVTGFCSAAGLIYVTYWFGWEISLFWSWLILIISGTVYRKQVGGSVLEKAWVGITLTATLVLLADLCGVLYLYGWATFFVISLLVLVTATLMIWKLGSKKKASSGGMSRKDALKALLGGG